jgi:hypothetical protein
MVSGWSLMGKFDGAFRQGMMWIALLSRLGIILDRQASWMVAAAVRAPLVPGNAGSGLFRAADPEQTTAWHAYLDKDNWGSANGCHLSTGSRLPVPPIEPQLQRSICQRRVSAPGHRVGGDGTKTGGPRQIRQGGRYMATLPAVARLRRGALDRDVFSSKHHPALIFSTRGAEAETSQNNMARCIGTLPTRQSVSKAAQAFCVGRHHARARDATAMETARLFRWALARHSSRCARVSLSSARRRATTSFRAPICASRPAGSFSAASA